MNAHMIELTRLAMLEPGKKRDDVTLALTDMLASKPLHCADTLSALSDILRNLVVAASRDLRVRVAAKIADAAWAPRELVMALALDEIDVAAPVIERSMALLEADLIDISRHGSRDHRRTLAARPDIGERVSDALSAQGETDVLVALLRNVRARLSTKTLHTCLDAAKTCSDLHVPLVERDDLPVQIVEAAYLMLGEELRARISERYEIDEPALRRILQASVSEAVVQEANHDQRETEAAALAIAMRQSGKLTGEFVARAALEKRFELFEHSVALNVETDVESIRRALKSKGAWAVALACRACDVRRQSFSAVHRALAVEGRTPLGVAADAERTAANAYMGQTPSGAADALRKLCQDD